MQPLNAFLPEHHESLAQLFRRKSSPCTGTEQTKYQDKRTTLHQRPIGLLLAEGLTRRLFKIGLYTDNEILRRKQNSSITTQSLYTIHPTPEFYAGNAIFL